MSLLEATDLAVERDGKIVVSVDRLTLGVPRGGVFGFLGPNGAGKSTTMRILTCFISPTQGTAKVRGNDVFDDTLAVRQSLGYLPQRAPLYLEMTVFEYLRFAAGQAAHGLLGAKAGAGRVGVPPFHPDPRQQPCHLVYHPLRADAELPDVALATLPAAAGQPGPPVTPVTQQVL
jgi:ABC-type transport system involved in cytochrome bd biosynthesis fused ATPase/permease subunit